MILWTTARPEEIFPPKAEKSAVRKISGGLLEGIDTAEGFVVGRLIATDPKLYLRADYTPGTIKK